jgi:hypothetical protein
MTQHNSNEMSVRELTVNSNRNGLYRVWVPLHNDGKVPLVCVWIDPKMTAFGAHNHAEHAEAVAVTNTEEAIASADDGPRCAAPSTHVSDAPSIPFRHAA